jgi:hypothetical protein
MTTNSALQKILKEILHSKMKIKTSHEKMEIIRSHKMSRKAILE